MCTAYQLSKEGLAVAVLEDGKIGSGETGRTTAHIFTAYDDRYFEMEKTHGLEAAKAIAESQWASVNWFEKVCETEGIDCDFMKLDGYLCAAIPLDERHSETSQGGGILGMMSHERQIRHEYDTCTKLGLPVEWMDKSPLPWFDISPCIKFRDQAQFHPMKFLGGLSQSITRRMGRIFEHTHAAGLEKTDGGVRVQTNQGKRVRARFAVVATNTPVFDLFTMHTKQSAWRTYAIAANIPKGTMPFLLWDTADPYHYVRFQTGHDGLDQIIVGGEDHRTGHPAPGGPDAPFLRLERWMRKVFPMARDVTYRWSGQVMEPIDGAAFIGHNPGDKNVFIITGDSGHGMTHSATAAMLLSDMICGRPNSWAAVFDPSRKTLRAAMEWIKDQSAVSAGYSKWLRSGDYASVEDVPRGCGGVVWHGGRRECVFRTEEGEVRRFTSVCPHLMGPLVWNPKEKRFECPAHGSRFDVEGHVINGPANKDLEQF